MCLAWIVENGRVVDGPKLPHITGFEEIDTTPSARRAVLSKCPGGFFSNCLSHGVLHLGLIFCAGCAALIDEYPSQQLIFQEFLTHVFRVLLVDVGHGTVLLIKFQTEVGVNGKPTYQGSHSVLRGYIHELNSMCPTADFFEKRLYPFQHLRFTGSWHTM